MGSSRRGDGIVLSETLFDIETDPETPQPLDPVTDVRRKRSPEFEKMRAEVHAKKERRLNRPRTVAAAKFERSCVEVRSMIDSDRWDGVGATHLVALYGIMHAEVYGVECIELGPQERYNATMMAANMVKRIFDGSYIEAVNFMRWAWEREANTEKWRRENGRTAARRIGARLMFSGSMVTDYLLEKRRRSVG